jgi:hypothetical protein
MSDKSILVQQSDYWSSWQESKRYAVQINIYNAAIDVDVSSTLRSSLADTYVVAYLAKDRAGSKRKTSICKKSLMPAWHECVLFSDIDLAERLVFELKMPAWGSLNPALASATFNIADIVLNSHSEMKSKIYTLTPSFQGVLSANITLGFYFNPPVSGKISTDVPDKTPVYLNAYGAFTSFMFVGEVEKTAEVVLQPPPRKGFAPKSKSLSSSMKLFNNPTF